MATRNRLPAYNFYPAGTAISGTATTNSNPVYILNLDNIGLQLNVAGTANGTFTVQISVDYNQDAEGNVTNVGHWIDLRNADGTPVSETVAASSPSEIYFDLNQLSAPWVRIQFVSTSGSGTVSGFASGKMI